MKVKRQQSTGFKAEAVRLVQESGGSIREIAKELGIGPSTLHSWVKEAQLVVQGSSAELQQELKRLREENKLLRLERDILKKTALFFAKEKRHGFAALRRRRTGTR